MTNLQIAQAVCGTTPKHFEGYAEARAIVMDFDTADLLAVLDSLYGRGEMNENTPREIVLQEALRQHEIDWRE